MKKMKQANLTNKQAADIKLAALIILLLIVIASNLLSGCEEKQKELKPWTVVCDRQGHYTFTEEDAKPWTLDEWDSYKEAEIKMLAIKETAEQIEKLKVQSSGTRRRINSRSWESCPEAPMKGLR